MEIKYYEDKIIEKNRKSIFIAGPTPRNQDVKSWRKEAIEILQKLKFDGDVFVPEFKTGIFRELEYKEVIEWETEHRDRADLILFWVPRDMKIMPALTTNIEFGLDLKSGKVVYGRPADSENNRYLDYIYEKEYEILPYETLEETIKACVEKLIDKKPKTFFTSDTHFGSEKILNYSFRPYKNIEEMDKDLVRKWNKKVCSQDVVYHIGDFGNYDMAGKLNGKIVLILGNYEKRDLKENYNGNFQAFKQMLLEKGFNDVIENGTYVQLDKEKAYLIHEPLKCKKDIFNLFGHIHEKCRCKKFGLNVGVDCSNYEPLSLQEVLVVKNAIQNYYDENVFCTTSDLKN